MRSITCRKCIGEQKKEKHIPNGPSASLEAICDCACSLGEAPLWHPLEQRLYWCNVEPGALFRYDPRLARVENLYEGDAIGGFTIQQDGALLLFMARGAVKAWREGRLTTVLEVIPDERETRFNDVIADPAGRVFCGSMPTKERPGRLYRLDLDATLTRVLEGIGCANGMGFSPDRKHMYFTDSGARSIYVFDYDERTGALANQRLFVRTTEPDGIPDGLTVDSAGYVWSAQWDGACVVRYTPEGKEERRIALPARKITSLAFGGANYTDIYATSAGGDNRVADRLAGSLFRLNAGISGVPEFFSRVRT